MSERHQQCKVRRNCSGKTRLALHALKHIIRLARVNIIVIIIDVKSGRGVVLVGCCRLLLNWVTLQVGDGGESCWVPGTAMSCSSLRDAATLLVPLLVACGVGLKNAGCNCSADEAVHTAVRLDCDSLYCICLDSKRQPACRNSSLRQARNMYKGTSVMYLDADTGTVVAYTNMSFASAHQPACVRDEKSCSTVAMLASWWQLQQPVRCSGNQTGLE